jgi:histidine ammonia-lyase
MELYFNETFTADLIGTISLEAFDGRIEPFNELIHFIRPHKAKSNS